MPLDRGCVRSAGEGGPPRRRPGGRKGRRIAARRGRARGRRASGRPALYRSAGGARRAGAARAGRPARGAARRSAPAPRAEGCGRSRGKGCGASIGWPGGTDDSHRRSTGRGSRTGRKDRPDLRERLRRRFEIGAHPLALRGRPDGRGSRPDRFRDPAGEAVAGYLLEPDGRGRRRRSSISTPTAGATTSGRREVLDGREALHGPLGPVLARGGVPGAGDRHAVLRRAGGGRGGRGGEGGALVRAARSPGRCWASSPRRSTGWRAIRGPTRRGSASSGCRWGRRSATGWAAVEPRLAAVAQLCCFADFGPLIASGAHDRHGHLPDGAGAARRWPRTARSPG